MEILQSIPWWAWLILVLAVVAIRDIFFNKKHTITHNFPILGHFRYMLEKIGPELRQYIVANNREELPFNRTEEAGYMLQQKTKIIIKVLVQIKIFFLLNIYISKMGCFLLK